MPTKPGPNGTKRYYNPRNGRYCKNTISLDSTKKKKTKEQKKAEEKESIFMQALNSTDKNIYEIYEVLEHFSPGSVKAVNIKIFDKANKKLREIDIMTDKCIYEIKSGKAKHKMKQYLAQLKLAKLKKIRLCYFHA